MEQSFLNMIDSARGKACTPFVINSGYRCLKHNFDVGGAGNSSHTLGLAADIKCTESRERSLIISALYDVGFNRMGIAKTYIHVDFDLLKDRNVTWLY